MSSCNKKSNYTWQRVAMVFITTECRGNFKIILIMKKLLLALLTILFILSITSCSTTKKDCRGNKHYKEKGGFYL